MKSVLVSYADEVYLDAQRKLHQTAYIYGVPLSIPYTRNELIRTSFYLHNKTILDVKKGGGLWLWKPYIIAETLRGMDYGDIALYVDAGMYITGHLSPLISLTKNTDILLFNINHTNKFWTKRDCFVYMDCDSKLYWETMQSAGFLQIYVKSPLSVSFVDEWLKFCQNRDILTDLSNTCGLDNFKGFVDHRHDQSVLSNLRVKYNLPQYPDPTQYGGFLPRHLYNSEVHYSTLFYHHRLRYQKLYIRVLHSLYLTAKRILNFKK
ncbi:hypothetical protein COT50_02480 [candidate division WWE3 bacterium CG08_land_8_20_14_0_20_41_10]|uniref:Nucleotide-diphospho-sugar transferase domain-containing protein n=1 Tax=candidate division WWE3 bacterium CG08_land_8_20_14_0_20_41_10 TaxID=1975085 RepID=A0A2H0XBN7_UNCKA|nr:MAG: hypothetical protein COT50_02480 [candidate division WWE3 bacterium CG08_land_8_20_14_0_20_41_10]